MEKRVAENLTYESFLTKLKEVCSPRVTIANFQRNYVWAPKHIKKLIESIDQNEKGFYLGSIVIQKGNSGASGRDIVVDGQQRLVTLSFILLSLRSVIKGVSGQRSINRLLFEDPDRCRDERISFSRQKAKVAYAAILRLGVIRNKKDEVGRRLHTRFVLVDSLIKKIEQPDVFLEKVKNLELVVIKCPSIHDVNQLYEGLNSTGKKLSAVEQTKNLLLGSALGKERKIKEIERIWEKLEGDFERSKPVWFDKFLRHQWFSVGGYASNADLFEEIRHYLSGDAKKVFNHSKTLRKDADIYLHLRRGDFSKAKLPMCKRMERDSVPEVKFLLDCIKLLNLDQIYALLLALIKFGTKHAWYLTNDLFLRDVEKLWSFFLLAKYSSISPSSYEKILANFCYWANSENRTKDIFQEHRSKKLFSELSALVSAQREVFISNIRQQIYYSAKGNVRSNDKQYVSSLLMIYLSRGEYFVPPRRTTIEHIVPEGSLGKWIGIGKEALPSLESTSRYQIGNLTLVARGRNDKNREMGNANFNQKYEKVLKDKSGFTRNIELIKFAKGFSGKDPSRVIKSRGEEMANEIYQILLERLVED